MGIKTGFPKRVLAVLLTTALLIPLGALADKADHNPQTTNPVVLIKTDRGPITAELFADKAPATVANFLQYATNYFYDGLIFHRVVAGFVIQTGGYTYDLVQKETRDPVVNESSNGLRNRRGTLAMARHADPDSATSQFYINLSNNTNLDMRGSTPGYTVFGQVTDGMKIADQIGKVPVMQEDIFGHMPVEPVQILSIRIINQHDQTERQSQ